MPDWQRLPQAVERSLLFDVDAVNRQQANPLIALIHSNRCALAAESPYQCQ